MKRRRRILVVDDEPTVREVLRRYLEREGWLVDEAADGRVAMQALDQDPPDLLILDLMLPGIDGLSITRRLRGDVSVLGTEHAVPIIMLTARRDEQDRVEGLELGADDYLTKPFSPRELVARVRAVLRRSDPVSQADGRPLQIGPLTLDPRAREVRRHGEPVALTAREFDLLWHLASNPRQVFSRDQLLDQVWGYNFEGDDSTVTVHVRRLREKIEPDPARPAFIRTVWSVGYRFEPDPDDSGA
ncbi:MAG: response regulator transcription factor [Anaerolineaceae bacterium]|nr:response regulator transcription factor [Anaerolineaceae bacterium]